jgi:hypothetical protein
MKRSLWPVLIVSCGLTLSAAPREHKAYFEPFIWKSEPPQDCPFRPSKDITGILFTGVHSDYHFADTWYPT